MKFRKPRISAQLANRATTKQPEALEGAVLAIARDVWKLRQRRLKHQAEVKKINRLISDRKKELRTLLRTEITVEREPEKA